MFAQTDKAPEININKQPLIDLGNEMNRKVVNKEIDLNAPFLVEISGVIDRSGSGKLEAVKIVRAEGDQHVVEAVKDVVIAIVDSGYLGYLRSMDIREVKILAKQDESSLSASLTSTLKTKERAAATASSLTALLTIAPMALSRESGPNKFDAEIFLLKSMKATAENEKVFLDFVAPKQKVREIIVSRLLKP